MAITNFRQAMETVIETDDLSKMSTVVTKEEFSLNSLERIVKGPSKGGGQRNRTKMQPVQSPEQKLHAFVNWKALIFKKKFSWFRKDKTG